MTPTIIAIVSYLVLFVIYAIGKRAYNTEKRMAEAVRMLEDMIDGGEECRGYDNAISAVIRHMEEQ